LEHDVTTSVIIAGARTPIGRLLGSLSGLSASDLGGIAIREALSRAGVDPTDVDAVIMGNVVQAGVGPNPARQASIAGGIGFDVPAITLNKLCLSGLSAIAHADQLIRLGEHEVIVAGGFESMTNAPHMVLGSRKGTKYGAARMVDALDQDALTCAFDGVSMGAATERYQASFGLTREAQDEFANASHARAAQAAAEGRFDEEIVEVFNAKGDLLLAADEGVRPSTTVESLGKLRAAFGTAGAESAATITAGNASQLSDGGAAVVMMSRARAEALGLAWLAEVGAYGNVAGPDPSLVVQPARAIRDALRRDALHGVALGRDDAALTLDDIDLFEINEAFAGVALASSAELGVSADITNVNGGAIALGHPVGMSGARIVLALALELRRRGGGVGAAALCGGGGQGDALIIRVPAKA
jgi:acetyl-CoA C-acetyltransferase